MDVEPVQQTVQAPQVYEAAPMEDVHQDPQPQPQPQVSEVIFAAAVSQEQDDPIDREIDTSSEGA